MPDDLVLELKKLIIATLKLEDVTPEDIEDDGQLFGTGLGLDSIDALELVVALEKTYGSPSLIPKWGSASSAP